MGESLGELIDRSLVAPRSINRQRDSLELLTDFMEAMPKSRVHVLRNLYFGDENKFELYAASKTLPASREHRKAIDELKRLGSGRSSGRHHDPSISVPAAR